MQRSRPTAVGGVLAGALLLAIGCTGPGARRPTAESKPPGGAARATPPPSADLPELIEVAGGVFMMGGDYVPAHREEVAAFDIGRTEVTTAAYRKCVQAGACAEPIKAGATDMENFSDQCKAELAHECNYERTDREQHPINCVTFEQAEAYCRWRGQRLPTEVEWEFAARGMAGRRFPWGNSAWTPERANLCDQACRDELHCPVAPLSRTLRDGYRTTSPVGTYPAGESVLGIQDLLGNVWEWTSTAVDPKASFVETPAQVGRGASWGFSDDPQFPAQLPLKEARQDIGFRCARTP